MMASARRISRFCVRNERPTRLHLRPRCALACYSTNKKPPADCCSDSRIDDEISKLDIDRESPLKGTVAAHQRHIVFATGDRPWPSKIDFMAKENGNDYVVDLLQRTKARFGRGAQEPRVSSLPSLCMPQHYLSYHQATLEERLSDLRECKARLCSLDFDFNV